MTDLAPLTFGFDPAGVNAAIAGLDKVTDATKDLDQATAGLGAATAKSSATMKDTATTAAQVANGLKAGAAAANENSAAHKKMADAVGFSRMQMLEATHVAKSLFDQLAAGASPMRAITLEGGRIAEIFSQGGGVSATIKAASASFSGMFTASRLAAGGVLGLGAAGIKAFADYESGQQRLAQSMQGVGRYSGLTQTQLNAVGARGAERGNLSTSSALDLAAGNNATGKIGGGLNADLISITKRFGQITGQDTADAGAELAKAFADPLAGADALDKKLGFLDSTTRNLIRTQADSLDPLGAQRTLFQALADDVAHATDNTWSLGRAYDNLKDKLSDVKSGAGHAVQGFVAPTATDVLKERLGAFNAQTPTPVTQDNIVQRVLGMVNPFNAENLLPTSEAMRQVLGKRLSESLQQVDGQARKALLDSATINSNRLSLKGDALIRSGDPDIDRREALEARLKSLTEVSNDPVAAAKLGAPLQATVSSTTASLAAFATSAQRVGIEASAAAQITMARSAAERTALEAAKAYNDAIRDRSPLEVAAANAEAVRTRAIASATKQLEDASRGVNDAYQLAGKSPYERAMLQAGFADRDSRRETYIPGSAALAGSSSMSLVKALEQVESGGNPNTGFSKSLGEDGRTSSAYGAGQITRAAEQDIRTVLPSFDRTIPSQTDTGVAAYIKILTQRFGSEDEAIKHYRGSSNPAINDAYLAKVRAAQGGGGSAAGMDVSGFDTNDAKRRATVGLEMVTGPLGQSSRELAAQNALLATQKSTIGQTVEQIATAAKERETLNSFLVQGVTLSDKERANVHELAKGYGDAAKQAADYQKSIATADMARNGFKDTAHTITSDLMEGRGRDIGRDLTKSFATKAVDGGINSLSDSLLGKQGTPGSGLLGQFLPGGSNGLSTANIQAGVVNLMGGAGLGGLGGASGSGGLLSGIFGGGDSDAARDAAQDAEMFGGASTGGGGLLASLFSAFKFKDGGIMSSAGSMPLHRYATGGIANSPQMAIFGEGRGPEAFVPLPDGRSIPVNMRGMGAPGGGGAPVINHSQTNYITPADGVTPAQLKAVLDQQNKEMTRNIGSTMANWQKRYG